jgi:hypothetical protein
MKKDKLIELARQAGFAVDEESMKYQPNCIFHTNHLVDELLNKFADLIVKECENYQFQRAVERHGYDKYESCLEIREHFGVK